MTVGCSRFSRDISVAIGVLLVDYLEEVIVLYPAYPTAPIVAAPVIVAPIKSPIGNGPSPIAQPPANA